MGTGNGFAGGFRPDLCGPAAVPHHCIVAFCLVAADAPRDRWSDSSCGEKFVLDFECAASGLAGKDQLQLVFVAASICVRETLQTWILYDFCGWAGERFLLSGGAADAAAARKERTQEET